MQDKIRLTATAFLVVGSLAATGCCGIQGHVYNGQAGATGIAIVPRAHIVFTQQDGGKIAHTFATVDGTYQIDLPEGRYVVTATKSGFVDYTSPAPVLVVGNGYDAWDIFMDNR